MKVTGVLYTAAALLSKVIHALPTPEPQYSLVCSVFIGTCMGDLQRISRLPSVELKRECVCRALSDHAEVRLPPIHNPSLPPSTQIAKAKKIGPTDRSADQEATKQCKREGFACVRPDVAKRDESGSSMPSLLQAAKAPRGVGDEKADADSRDPAGEQEDMFLSPLLDVYKQRLENLVKYIKNESPMLLADGREFFTNETTQREWYEDVTRTWLSLNGQRKRAFFLKGVMAAKILEMQRHLAKMWDDIDVS
ncbi:uncharacterized protein PV09_04621 [Verruconis gallopava]|uniref:Uncharacterized protein n=1 Tax=Verruconis gallopava TaxID=253628 RepID=A0A0D2ACZ7_9PEZI|nr:uncharacterized protein PV09_04621 [Verruconis gallopava]KIW04330.1 hypothetical protein PV09_04621 [Verruconis gallopava]